jgi:hypothetical protein
LTVVREYAAERLAEMPERARVEQGHAAGFLALAEAGSSLLRTTLVRAANTARTQDPQLARIYYQQMTNVAKTTSVPGVVAACLGERAWTMTRRGTPYVICDTSGQRITPAQAKAIIAKR